MMPEKLSHRALMLVINAKCDYIISRISAMDYVLANGVDGQGRVVGYVRKAQKKLEDEIKRIVALDKTKGGFNGD